MITFALFFYFIVCYKLHFILQLWFICWSNGSAKNQNFLVIFSRLKKGEKKTTNNWIELRANRCLNAGKL